MLNPNPYSARLGAVRPAGQASLPDPGTAAVLLLVLGGLGAAYWAMSAEQKEQRQAYASGRSYYREAAK